MNICVYGASSNMIDKKYIEKTEELGRKMAQRGHTLVFGAGSGGMMGAVARGVYKEHGYMIGVVPSFFNIDGVLFPHCNELIYTETMRERKKILFEKSDAFIMTPGGIGTFDEFFEVLTLKQLSRHTKAIVIYNVDGYYNDMVDMLVKTAKQGFMAEASLNLFKVFDDAVPLFDWIEKYEAKEIKIEDMKNIPTK